MDKQERWYLENIDLAGQVVADVGANVGRISQFFWENGRGSTRVVSIEPLPKNVRRIEARISECGATNWSVQACAATAYSGEVTLQTFSSAESGDNSAVRAVGRREGEGLLTVPCRTLREVVPDATVVKVDIEGHEYTVLDQALGEMEHVHTWTVELHMVEDRPLQGVLRQLEAHGFSLEAATHTPGDKSGGWVSRPIPSALSWNQIPVTKRRADGSVFKMVHIMAKRG